MRWLDLKEEGSGVDYSSVFRPVQRNDINERISPVLPVLLPDGGPSDPRSMSFVHEGFDCLYVAEGDCEDEITFFCSLPDAIVSCSIAGLYDTVVRPVWLMPGVARAMAVALP